MSKQILYTSDLTRKKNLSLYTIFVINPEQYQPDIDELVINKGRSMFYLEPDVVAIAKHALTSALGEPTKVANDPARQSLLNRLTNSKPVYIVLAEFIVEASPSSPIYCNPVDTKPLNPEYDLTNKTVIASLTDKQYTIKSETYQIDEFVAKVGDDGSLKVTGLKVSPVKDED